MSLTESDQVGIAHAGIKPQCIAHQRRVHAVEDLEREPAFARREIQSDVVALPHEVPTLEDLEIGIGRRLTEPY